MERPNAWKKYDEQTLLAVEEAAKNYKAYLDAGKTERECAAEAIRLAKEAGYTDLKEAIAAGREVKPGDKLYYLHMGKAVMLFHMGKQPLENGLNIIGAHIDSPRIDVKQNPFYEDNDIAYADTPYYGGVKKYQWVARALALHGVVAKKDGTLVNIVIGEDDDDPVVGISDLLIHLSQEQMQKKASEVITGEGLDIMLAGRPLTDSDDEKEPVKAMLLKILKEKYDLDEEDMLSAEIEAVPAGKARDYGLDRSMILGYGHDDRVCAYAEITAMMKLPAVPEYTCCCLLADKEEIGSVGATGMRSRWFEDAMAEVLELAGESGSLPLRRCLERSCVLSNDVSVGYDPAFPSVYDPKNAAYLGHGVSFIKFTGARGKGGSNDADAEYVAALRRVMDEAGVHWQTSELGKVDAGGGGTIAYMLANYGMSVIDCGIPVLSMHAPWEVTSKADVFEAYRAYKAFLNQR